MLSDKLRNNLQHMYQTMADFLNKQRGPVNKKLRKC